MLQELEWLHIRELFTLNTYYVIYFKAIEVLHISLYFHIIFQQG